MSGRRAASRSLWLTAAMLLAACIPTREVLFPAIGLQPPALRDFPADFQAPRSAETELPMPGFGGGAASGVYRTPVIFIHGNTVSARFWLPVREYFLQHGYSRDELWAFGYGWDSVHYFDANDLSVPSVERMVGSVMAYLSQQRGYPVRQVDIVAHSMGVTLVRQWLLQTNSYHRVRSFVGIAGANHGTWTAMADSRARQRAVSWELHRGSPWLAQLNRPGETPGPTRYMSLYDGSGWADVFYPKPDQDSSALQGAVNLAYNRERGTGFDHLELARRPETLAEVLKFLAEPHEPLPRALPPKLLRQGDRLYSDQPAAHLHCAAAGEYPNRSTAGVKELRLDETSPLSCYARNPESELSSPVARFARAEGYVRSTELAVSASLASGAYEQAQSLELSSSDPAAFIVYTSSGTPPNSGSALYRPGQPIYIAAPLRLQAMAVAPDGRSSPPLVLDIDISLEKVEAAHTLERQFDATAPEQYQGRRKKGH